MTGNPLISRGGVRPAAVLLLGLALSASAQAPKELERAVALEQNGKPDRAIALLRSVLERDPQSAEAHNWLGVAYLQKNALADAETEFRRAIQLKPGFVRAYNNLGSTLAQGGDIPGGIRVLEQGLKYAPRDLQLRINLGMALRSKGDAEGALALFRSLIGEHPGSPELQHQLGQTLRQKGDLNAAVEAFEKALDLDPEVREVYYALGQALKEAAARNRPKPGTHRVPPDAAAQFKSAGQAFARGDAKAAQLALETALRIDPEYADAHNLLGFVLGRGGDLASALPHLLRAVALDPGMADAHYNLGVALWYRGDRGRAVGELDEALRIDPAAASANDFRGVAARETGDLLRARRMFQRAVALDPQSPGPYFDLGVVFLRLGLMPAAIGQFEAGLNLPAAQRRSVPDLELAVTELRGAVSAAPDAQGWNTLGRMLGLAGSDAGQVSAAFEAAVRLKPDYAEALNNLGLVYAQTGDDEKAAGAFRRATRLRPDWAEAHQNLGAVLTTSDVAEAVRELETAVSLDQSLLKAQYNLAFAYGASPRHGPAREIEQLGKLLAVDARYPRAEFALGRALLRSGKVPEAVKHLRTAVAQEPGFGEAHYQLGLALSRSGSNAEGTAEIRKGREMIASAERNQLAGLNLAEARAALDSGDTDQALAKARETVKLRADSAESHYLLGLVLAKKGEELQAEEEFRTALSIDPGHSASRQALDRMPAARTELDDPKIVVACEQEIREQRFSDAEQLLKAYIETHPKSSWGWYALGYSYFGQKKVGDSIRALARSLELNVDNPDAHKVLGRGLMLIGRFDAAKTEFEQGARLDPKSAEMPYNLGKLFSILDNWAGARKQFERALALDPGYMEAWDGLGLALESLGEDEPAIADYRKAIELNEQRHAGFSSPYVNLSALYNRTGNALGAAEYARKALDVNAKSDRALFQFAKSCEYRGDLAAAADALNQAISINPHSSSYFYVLATVYRKLGKADDSRKAMESFARLDRESNDLDRKRRELSR